jgi:hypothetical protein
MSRRTSTAGLGLVITVTIGALGYQSRASSSSTATSRWPDRARPDDSTILADDVPGVANLDPALLDAVRRATSHAARWMATPETSAYSSGDAIDLARSDATFDPRMRR